MDRTQRDAIVERDEHTCVACGCRTGGQVHHILGRAQGGSDEPHNLATLCGYCHMLVSPIRVDVMTRLFGLSERELLVWKARIESAIYRWVLSVNGETECLTGRPRIQAHSKPRRAKEPKGERHKPEWKCERPRAGCVWTPEEDAALRADVGAGLPLTDIARRLGRGTFAIEVRMSKLGVVGPSRTTVAEDKSEVTEPF